MLTSYQYFLVSFPGIQIVTLLSKNGISMKITKIRLLIRLFRTFLPLCPPPPLRCTLFQDVAELIEMVHFNSINLSEQNLKRILFRSQNFETITKFRQIFFKFRSISIIFENFHPILIIFKNFDPNSTNF